MNFKEVKRSAEKYLPAIILERIISRKGLKSLNNLFFFLTLLLVLFSAVVFFLGEYLPDPLVELEYQIYGLGGIVLAFWSTAFAFYSFSNYYRFLDIARTPKERVTSGIRASFEVSEILYETGNKDPVFGFMSSTFGSRALLRCGIPYETTRAFLSEKKNSLNKDALTFPDKKTISVRDHAEVLYRQDTELAEFIFNNGLQEHEYLGAVRWLEDIFVKLRKMERWWSEENLKRVEPIGDDWAYGKAYELEKFSQPIEALVNINESLEEFHEKEIGNLEVILSRSQEANALLISEAGTGKLAVIAGLASKIRSENIIEMLAHKKILVLDTGMLIAATGDKTDFENELITILNQTAKAGNVILVIDNLPYLINSATSFGSDVTGLLDSYLDSPDINVLALTDKANFHNIIESNTTLMARFEYVIMEDIREESVISLLEEKLISLESSSGVMFTYPALLNIVSSAKRYFPGGVMPDKAVDLLVELAPSAASKGIEVIDKKNVDDFVREKTGIPVGEVTEEERDTLSHLEDILHERVVGQDQAINAVSNALKRARSGISDPNRPLGSFLFLGPTGVGKTETSKALAEIFFESSEEISRLDMSEYQGSDALGRLIGSLGSGKVGTLASMLREKPYAVLLLDEFEKADKDVHNLFLQVLDEGVFSDASGKEVNARNTIVIATSNAGSDLIWEYEQKGENIGEKTPEIIDKIIQRGIFSPELLNRFDGVILFHPLEKDHLEKVAELEVEKLRKRVREKGVEIEVSRDVIDHLVEVGSDPKFGARALRRAVQDNLEKAIANKLISEGSETGATLRITKEDIAS
ncbi:MAG: AAA family ATPase [Candidatus Paceibacterota bacterium]